jgi:hypothetical protein
MGSKPFTGAIQNSPMVAFPKYNNYLLDRDKFDVNSRVLVPLQLLGIKSLQQGKDFFEGFVTTKIFKPKLCLKCNFELHI